ncbi:MAG: TetR/AcrR family transcriptional regulator [Deltaproteobacteria bacterium]|nr:TetR/AcrR family transcriptional regulator [Deltaproteobacteria bacterium]MBW2117762.1 TetR/AcrR family transcriptional regulator [Deltaproteobacteria bacterium]MBW2344089.1 TetR/AcrR family transcriptional regulator [Deltaproteobacteria bacterium]
MSKKQAILQVATKLFSKKGFKDTSIADLANVIGTAQGTIFYHFNSKEQLFLSVLKSVKDGIIEEFERYLRERDFKIGLEMAEGAISFYLSLAGTREEWFLILHRHDAYELAAVNNSCRQNLEGIYNSILSIFEKAVLLGQDDGSIADMPARKTALIIFAMVDGLVRFNTYKLYDAGALYNELISSCRRILQNKHP